MPRFLTGLAAVLCLSACGAAGLPERPQGGQTDGVVFSGDARMGLTYNSAPRLRN